MPEKCYDRSIKEGERNAILHSADLHIDRSFEGVHLLSEKVKTQLPAINQKSSVIWWMLP